MKKNEQTITTKKVAEQAQTVDKQTTKKQTTKKVNKQTQTADKKVAKQTQTVDRQTKQVDRQTKQVGPTKSKTSKLEMSVREKEKKEIVKLFKKGKTVYQIAKQLGKYYSQIAPILENEGLTWTKRPSGPTNKRNYSIYCSPDQYEQVKQLLKSNK